MTGARLAVCPCMTEGARPKHTHSYGVRYMVLGWYFAITRPLRPGLAADVIPGLQRRKEGTGKDSGGWSQ